MKKVLFSIVFLMLTSFDSFEDEPCLRARILIAMDISRSMDTEFRIRKMNDLQRELVSGLPIDNPDVKVGLIYFSDVMRSYDFIGDRKDLSALVFLNKDIERSGGTEFAIPLVWSHIAFASEESSDFEKIVILLSDGELSDVPSDSIAAKMLRDDGVRIYSVKIGGSVIGEQVLEKVSSPGGLFFDSGDLIKEIEKLGPCM